MIDQITCGGLITLRYNSMRSLPCAVLTPTALALLFRSYRLSVGPVLSSIEATYTLYCLHGGTKLLRWCGQRADDAMDTSETIVSLTLPSIASNTIIILKKRHLGDVACPKQQWSAAAMHSRLRSEERQLCRVVLECGMVVFVMSESLSPYMMVGPWCSENVRRYLKVKWI